MWNTANPLRLWLIGAGLVGVVVVVGGLGLWLLGPMFTSAALNLEDVPTPIAALPTLTASLTPARPTATPVAMTGALAGRIWLDVCPPGGETSPICAMDKAGRFQGNGQYEPGESGVGGVTVRLGAGQCPATGLAEAKTGPDGQFRFTKLNPGTYCVSIKPAENPVLAAGGWTTPTVKGAPYDPAFLPAAVAAGSVTENMGFAWDPNLPPTPTPTPSPTITLTPSKTFTPSSTPTLTRTPRPTSTRTVTKTPFPTSSVTLTPSITPTASWTPSNTPVPPTATATVPTKTPTVAPTPVRGVTLRAAVTAQAASAGITVTYPVTLTNSGAFTDSYFVSISGASATINPVVISKLSPNASTVVTATVALTSGMSVGQSLVNMITAVSGFEPLKNASLTLTTTVAAIYGLQATGGPATQAGDPGAVLTYTVLVTNTGNAADTYSVALTSTYPALSSTASLAGLAPGASAPVTLTVTIPSNALAGASQLLSVTLRSAGNPAAFQTLGLTTTVNPIHGFLFSPGEQVLTATVAALAPITHTLAFTSTSNLSDVISVTLQIGGAFTVTAPLSPTFTLPAFGNLAWNLVFDPAGGAVNDFTVVTATFDISGTAPLLSATGIFTTTIWP